MLSDHRRAPGPALAGRPCLRSPSALCPSLAGRPCLRSPSALCPSLTAPPRCAAPGAVVDHNFAFHTCPTSHDCAHGEFDLTFEFLHPVKGSSDNFISGGLIFGATQASGGFLILEFPTVSHLWDHDRCETTVSRATAAAGSSQAPVAAASG